MDRKKLSGAVATGIVAAIMMFTSPGAHGAGLLAPTDVDLPPMRMVSEKIAVDIDQQTARTRITQVFANDLNRQLEAHYIFPIPKGAQVSEFFLWINGEKTKAEILEAGDARRIYESIVRQARDPGLLEYIDRELFRVRVFPIPPHGSQKVEINLLQTLPVDHGAVQYTLPMHGPGGERELQKGQMTFDFAIDSDTPIKSIYSPSHPQTIHRSGEKRVRGSLDMQADPRRDVALVYTLSPEDIGLTALAYRADTAKPGYFNLLIAPPFEIDEDEIQPKAVTFVIDTSGSMKDEDKMEQARDALVYCLNSLRRKDMFNVIGFASTVASFRDELAEAEHRTVEKAVKWVKALEARGGTNIDSALAEALDSHPPKDTPHTIVFLTDGRPTVGEQRPPQILAQLTAREQTDLRVFTFGVGYDVNTRLLDELAEEGRGAADYIRPREDIEVAVSNFYDKVSSPVMTELELDIDGVRIEDVFPRRLPDLFLGTQLVVFGRYRGDGEARVRLSGNIMGEKQICEYETVFPEDDDQYGYIEPLWANRKIGYLLDEIRRHGENKEVVEEVTELAMKYEVATPYTSFLVAEDKPVPASLALNRHMDSTRLGQRNAGAASPAPFATYDLGYAGDRDGSSSVQHRGTNVPGAHSVAPQPGREAVESSIRLREQKETSTLADAKEQLDARSVGDRVFHRTADGWIQRNLPDTPETVIEILYMSDAWFDLIDLRPDLKKALQLGENVTIAIDKNTVLKIGPEGAEKLDQKIQKLLKKE